MAIKSQDIKNGTVIRIDGKLQVVVSFLHVKPGKGNTFMRTKLKDVVSGYVTERRFNIGEVLEDVRVEHRPYQFLYMDGDDAVFMNQETFDQVTIDKKMIIGEEYMKEGDIVEVVSGASTETILTAEMPVKTVLQITYMEPGAKGNTATNTLTKATVETGGTVLVPLFCKEGDKIVVDTRDGSYVERAKE
jgi:elongation factor P